MLRKRIFAFNRLTDWMLKAMDGCWAYTCTCPLQQVNWACAASPWVVDVKHQFCENFLTLQRIFPTTSVTFVQKYVAGEFPTTFHFSII